MVPLPFPFLLEEPQIRNSGEAEGAADSSCSPKDVINFFSFALVRRCPGFLTLPNLVRSVKIS